MRPVKDTITVLSFPLALNAKSVGSLYSTTCDRLMVVDQNGKMFHKGNGPTAKGIAVGRHCIHR